MMGYTSSTSARMLNCAMTLVNRYYLAERQPPTRLLPPELLDSSSVKFKISFEKLVAFYVYFGVERST